MKHLLPAFAFCAVPAVAAPQLSVTGQAAVNTYNAMERCMADLAGALARVQDPATAETNAPAVLQAGQELKAILDQADEPYNMSKKAVTKADAFALRDCRYRLMTAGMAVQNEMLRLAKAEFYHSAALIKALQQLEMLDDATDSLIR